MPLYTASQQVAFPAATSERYYLPSKGGLATALSTPTRYTIAYLPFFIKKNTSSLKICIEQGSAGTINTCDVGIYSATNGLPSAAKIESGTITTTSSVGIFSYTVSLPIQQGWYICAGMVQTLSATTFRVFTTNNLISDDFGRDTSDTAIDTNYFYTQTGLTSLPSNIGTITRSATNTGLNVFLRY